MYYLGKHAAIIVKEKVECPDVYLCLYCNCVFHGGLASVVCKTTVTSTITFQIRKESNMNLQQKRFAIFVLRKNQPFVDAGGW